MAAMQLVVATDLSPASTPAVDHALQWARKLGASVTLLHVVHDPELAPALATDVPGDVANAKRALDAFAAQSAVPCRVDVRTANDVASAIAEAARGADYLLVGTHGRSGFQRLRLGSVATKVLRQSATPVVCVPTPATA